MNILNQDVLKFRYILSKWKKNSKVIKVKFSQNNI
jgi:hypothetical protein